MTVSVYTSSKFHHAPVQYFAEASGHTLLRLTCGYLGGEVGGAIKTATASDPGFAPAYRDREELIEAMRDSLQRMKHCALLRKKWSSLLRKHRKLVLSKINLL